MTKHWSNKRFDPSHWSLADIQMIALDLGIAKSQVNKFHCKNIASILEHNFDPSIGVNWDVIQINVQTYYDDLK